MTIQIRNLHKRFGASTLAADGLSLDVQEGELLALLGPSGCGKTTLLRIIAGLEVPDAGQLWLHGQEASSLTVNERRVGFVFQHYALFPHLTVFENIAFGLRVRPRATRPAESEIKRRVEELLSLVQLEGLARRHPQQLSAFADLLHHF